MIGPGPGPGFSSYAPKAAPSSAILAMPGLKLFHKADPAKLYSDAGVTLASDGGTVYRVADISPNGYNLDQRSGQSSANLPILHNPGGGVKPYLQFDGSNDGLILPTNVTLTAADGTHWFAFACSAASSSGIFASISGASTVATFTIGTSPSNAWAYSSFDTGAVATTDRGSAFVAGTPVAVVVQVNGAAKTVEILVNGNSAGATSFTGTANNVAAKLAIGSNQAVANYAQIQWYGDAMGTDLLTSDQIAAITAEITALFS